MDTVCTQCHTKFRIAAGKLPAGRAAAVPCPKCGTRLHIQAPPPVGGDKVPLAEVDSGAYNSADRPFDFVEEEGKTALVCEPDPRRRQAIQAALADLEYQITVAENSRDALKRMRYHTYDVLVVNEEFDTDTPESNGVLIYLERLSMAVRREMFVVLMSGRYRTMDNMTAFLKSVNLVVNNNNAEDFGKILSRGLTENLSFYRLFREKLKELGRA